MQGPSCWSRALGRGHVLVQAGERVLDHRNVVTVPNEDVVNRPPTGAVDEGPVHEQDVLHRRGAAVLAVAQSNDATSAPNFKAVFICSSLRRTGKPRPPCTPLQPARQWAARPESARAAREGGGAVQRLDSVVANRSADDTRSYRRGLGLGGADMVAVARAIEQRTATIV